jgi:hypothetical protein
VVHGFETKDMQVIVVNMLGQTIYQSVEQEAVITIDLQHAPQGSYILIMRNEETEVHQPIKIQR